MKIALLTKYGDLAASTRQRFHQYRPFLEATGFELIRRPLLDDGYLNRLYEGGGRNHLYVAARYFSRLRWLISRPDTDLIWLHCELFPYLPGFIERIASWPRKPIIFDYDDAIFHNYDQHKSSLVRNLLGRKLEYAISGAEVVFAGNTYLANYAHSFCAQTEIIPSVVDTSSYKAGTQRDTKNSTLRVGWIGTPSTWSDYMAGLIPTLMPILEGMNGQLAVMGANCTAAPQERLILEDWSEKSEVPFLQSLDIGIMPLTDTPWAQGKCGYKLIQYMACGLPVVASPVGVNSDIVEHGVNGFLATTDAEWNDAITTLLRDPDLRHRMGQAGRKKVEEQYSLKVWGPRVASLLRDAAERGRAS